MRYTFINSGIKEEVEFPEEAVNEIFIPLLKKLACLQSEKSRRILVLLAAPPGCGKSTLVDFLCYLSRNNPELKPISTIGMDGFHRHQDYLLTHTTVRDGEEIPMVKIKGAPVTFDLSLLKERISRLKSGETIGWPVYDRLLHNPVDNAVQVSGYIVILEGNYLLLNKDGWKDLRNYADYTIKLTADEKMLRDRLIKRKISTGVNAADAEKFVDFSDMYNVRLCLEKTGAADLEIEVSDGQYTLM